MGVAKVAQVAQPLDNGFHPMMTLHTYSIAEAARLISVPRTTLHDWTQPRSDARGEWGPLVERVPGQRALSFVSLAEAFVLAAVRAAGVSPQIIRPAVEKLREEIGLEYALASRRMFTDGAELLHEFAGDSRIRRAVGRLTAVRNGRCAFRPVAAGYLRRLVYEGGRVSKIRLETPGAAIIPGVGSGRPVFEAASCLVEVVLYHYDGGDAVEQLVEDFRVPAECIQAVIEQRPAWAEMSDRAKIRKAA